MLYIQYKKKSFYLQGRSSVVERESPKLRVEGSIPSDPASMPDGLINLVKENKKTLIIYFLYNKLNINIIISPKIEK